MLWAMPDEIKCDLTNMVKDCNLSNVPKIASITIIGKNIELEPSLSTGWCHIKNQAGKSGYDC